MPSNKIKQAQYLLYVWLSHFERKSYVSIKEHCEYLVQAYRLYIQSKPMWALFYPMMYSGVVDHVGNDYYAVAESFAIDAGKLSVIVNGQMPYNSNNDCPVGLNWATSKEIPSDMRVIRLGTRSILRSFPSVLDVLDTWNDSLQDESLLQYHDRKLKQGVAELSVEGLTRYFSIPSKLYLKEIPPRSINPEAYNIAICAERAINNLPNGVYRQEAGTFTMPYFAMPFLLHRALMIDGFAIGKNPINTGESVTFFNISKAVCRELNRILCNSVKYE